MILIILYLGFLMFMGPRMINTKYGQVIPELIFKALKSERFLQIIGLGEESRSFVL